MGKVVIPTFLDPEGYSGKVTLEDTHAFPIANNINAGYTALSVSPNLFEQVGTHSMKVILHDDNMSSYQFLTVDVLNDAPIFTVPVLESYRMHINKTLEVSVLNFSDTESHKVYMSF